MPHKRAANKQTVGNFGESALLAPGENYNASKDG